MRRSRLGRHSSDEEKIKGRTPASQLFLRRYTTSRLPTPWTLRVITTGTAKLHADLLTVLQLPTEANDAPLPALPAELHAYIISLVGEEYTSNFDTPQCPAASQALASLSLVSSSLRQLAQPELFRDLTLNSRLDVERWFSIIGEQDGWATSVARLVRTLRIGRLEEHSADLLMGPLHPRTAEDFRLSELLQACSAGDGGVRELKLASVGYIDLAVLKSAQGELVLLA